MSITIGTAMLTGGLLAPSAALATGDQLNTFRAAKQAGDSTAGRWLHGRLSSPTDRDWFAFTLPSAGRALVTLGHLPANYTLRVYDADGDVVGAAHRAGRRFEQLYLPLAAGRSYVRVSAATSHVVPDVDYVVKFRPLRTGLVFAEHKGGFDDTGFDVRGEVLNNTGHRLRIQQYTVRFFDKDGDTVGTTTEDPIAPGLVRARHRVEFEIERTTRQVPAGATSYRLTVSAVSSSDPIPHGVSEDPAATVDLSPNTRSYSGTVTNHTDHTITDVFPTVIEYDNRGRANAIGYGLVRSLAAGETKRYSFIVGGADLPRPNAVRQYVTIAATG